MDSRTAPTVSRGRVLAYRIVAGLVGAFFILTSLGFSVPQFFSAADKVHSFHDLATMPAFLVLLGFALIVMVLRPDDVVALRVAWAVALGAVIAGIIGHDVISNTLYPITVVAIGVLTILAPTRGELVRFGPPNVALLSLAIVAAIPAIVFAWDNARIMLQMDPAMDMSGHWKYHHWSGVAASALGVVLAAIVVSFSPGERMWTWVVGFATMLFGLAGIIFSDAARYPSSVGTLWGVGVLFVGLVYIVVAEISSGPQADAGAEAQPA
jgi:energy-coupling factor transporter transmembrane protein EcfT